MLSSTSGKSKRVVSHIDDSVENPRILVQVRVISGVGELFVWQKRPSRTTTSMMLQLLQRSVFPSSLRLCSTKRSFFASSWRGADPWLLPNTPEHLKSTTTPPDLPPPTPVARPNESVKTLRARLLYQSRKRGTLESDLLLSTFARDHLSEMGDMEMKEYDKVSRYHRILLFSDTVFSYWMNQIGTSITGPLGKGLRQNVGRILLSLKGSESTLVTREKLYVACLLCESIQYIQSSMNELLCI
jgi:succinate dehydrogenase flavin-adding protein (antitoxin of CptAB toxin-antitoxin module)